jgi:AcrR family transcriptional regulator
MAMPRSRPESAASERKRGRNGTGKRNKRPSEEGILASAEQVFAERGYAATPLRDLIAACGCSTTAFYARFDSKEAVLEALIRNLFLELHGAAIEALPRAGGVDEAYELGIKVLRSKLRGRKGLWRVVLTEGAHTERTRPLVREAYRALAAMLATELRRSAARGNIDPQDAEPLSWALVGTLSMHLTRWAVFDDLSDAKLTAALRDTVRTLRPRPQDT